MKVGSIQNYNQKYDFNNEYNSLTFDARVHVKESYRSSFYRRSTGLQGQGNFLSNFLIRRLLKVGTNATTVDVFYRDGISGPKYDLIVAIARNDSSKSGEVRQFVEKLVSKKQPDGRDYRQEFVDQITKQINSLER